MRRAVATRRRAVGRARKSDAAVYADRLADLGNARILLYGLTGDATELVRAVGELEGAVNRAPEGDQNAAGRMSSLGNALTEQSRVTGDPLTLARAVGWHRQAAEAAGAADPNRAMYMSNLADALLRDFEAHGKQPVLDEALRLYRDAVALTAAAHAELGPRLANQASAMLSAYERTGLQSLLEEGAANYRKAADSAAGQPEYRATYLHGPTDGMIGSLSHLVRASAQLAILEGQEAITRKLMEGVLIDYIAEADGDEG
jgi:hypothetical protein